MASRRIFCLLLGFLCCFTFGSAINPEEDFLEALKAISEEIEAELEQAENNQAISDDTEVESELAENDQVPITSTPKKTSQKDVYELELTPVKNATPIPEPSTEGDHDQETDMDILDNSISAFLTDSYDINDSTTFDPQQFSRVHAQSGIAPLSKGKTIFIFVNRIYRIFIYWIIGM